MQIQTDVSLKDYSTMRLGGVAKALVVVETKQDIADAVAWAKERNLPILPLGGGSNVIFSNGYPGLVIVNHITGYTLTEDDTGATLTAGAGENWDSVVERSVQAGLHGIEFLSAIPGTAGGTPVQNVGAYGTQIAQTLAELDAYDLQTGAFVTLSKADCKFRYRQSIFKTTHVKRYIITSITLRLSRDMPAPPFYASLQSYLDDHGITTFTPQIIRDAVIAIRAKKLPDPAKVASAGSFFKNPIMSGADAQKVLSAHPDTLHWVMKDGRVKFAAGWLIEQAGLRGYAAHGLHTSEHHALVVINDAAKSYSDLLAFQNEIIARVKDMFDITLEQEPELL